MQSKANRAKNSAMKYCLVTGGAGYVGSHFCKELANKTDFIPITLDNLHRGHSDFVKWGPLVEGDVRDKELLDNVFSEYHPLAVFHFAGLTYVGESVSSPEAYYEINFCGAKKLIDKMLEHGCKVFVFSSTAATYGSPVSDRIDETHEQKPINPYGWSKLMVEKLLHDYSSAYGLKFAALRYFNASGADKESEIGERHTPETHLVPLTIEAALGVRPNIKIFGTDYPTPDGTAIRDYIHVTDLASAHLKAMDYLMTNEQNICANLGTGRGYSVKEIVTKVQKTTGIDFEIVNGDRREGDPSILVAASDMAQQRLNWKPRHSDIDNIIKTAWNWHSKDSNALKTCDEQSS